MSRKPTAIIPFAFLIVSALSPAKADPPAEAGGPPLIASPIRMATLNVNAVMRVLCKDDIKKLREEATESRRHTDELATHALRESPPQSVVDGIDRPREFRELRPGLAIPTKQPNQFALREAAIYAKRYEELQLAVAEYCKAERIDLVRNDGRAPDPVDPDDPEAVAHDVSKRVVVSNVDITPAILKRLAAKADPAAKSR
jgi:hypothetical protein